MSTSIQTLHTPTALQHFVFAVVAALRSAAAAWQRGRRRRAAMRELDALDDHILQDIGVTRSELHSVAAQKIGAAPATRRAAMRRSP